MKNLPSFVTVEKTESTNPRIIRTLVICGQKYEQWDYDEYIDTAIKLAGRWKQNEVTYQRIVYLRGWLRENVQHTHDLSVYHIRTMQGCKKLIDKLIHAEFRYQEPIENKNESIKLNLEKCAEIFSSENNAETGLTAKKHEENIKALDISIGLIIDNYTDYESKEFFEKFISERIPNCNYLFTNYTLTVLGKTLELAPLMVELNIRNIKYVID